MSARAMFSAIALASVFAQGCAHLSTDSEDPPKTLFSWNLGAEDKSKESSVDKDSAPPEPDRLASDRPDFTEASSTVGIGRVQLEAGYTYFLDRTNGIRTEDHSYPEALLRIGILADWFELRIGQNVLQERIRSHERSQTGDGRTLFLDRTERTNGFQDLYVGAKFALTEQKQKLPEMALILQTTVPTGAEPYSNDALLPGFNFLFGWDVIEDCLTLAGSFGANRFRDDDDHYFGIVHQSLSVGYTVTSNMTAYTEFFALFPTSALAPDTVAQYYFNLGVQYFFSDNFALDLRTGFGLNQHSVDSFSGVGFVARY